MLLGDLKLERPERLVQFAQFRDQFQECLVMPGDRGGELVGVFREILPSDECGHAVAIGAFAV